MFSGATFLTLISPLISLTAIFFKRGIAVLLFLKTLLFLALKLNH